MTLSIQNRHKQEAVDSALRGCDAPQTLMLALRTSPSFLGPASICVSTNPRYRCRHTALLNPHKLGTMRTMPGHWWG